MDDHKIFLWGGFHVIIAFLLVCDFYIFQRHPGKTSFKKAWKLSALWIALALLFNVLIYCTHGWEPALQFFTAYLVEKALSVDNLFVFLMLFTLLHIPESHQRKILFWGILGAIVFRLAFILAGIELLLLFDWMRYVLGAFLCFTGIKLIAWPEKKIEPEKSIIMRFLRFLFPLAKGNAHGTFFVREKGILKITTLFLGLVLIESTDILFAFDSIPVVLAITQDPFVAYTSNIFAILGLRALYFVIAPLLTRFKHFSWGLAAILIFVGIKMVLATYIIIPLSLTLFVTIGILGITAFLSWKKP